MICCILTLIIIAVLFYGFLKLDCNPLLAFYERFFPNKQKLKNKTIWVVGASTGIGEEIALQLAELNCRLILTSTSENKLNEVAKECIKRSKNNLKPDDVLVIAYDISDFKKNDSAFKQIIDKFGNIDILVNNAARALSSKVEDDDFDAHLKLFDINLHANIYIAKLVIKHWRSIKSDGIIMPTSSVGAYFDIPLFSSYVATKKALQAIYRDIQLQTYKDGIRICVTNPGPTETQIGPKSIKIGGKRLNLGDSKKMSSKRCAELILIAMANKLSESWISEQPFLLLTYLGDRYHYQIHYISKIFNLIKFAERRFRTIAE